MGSGTLPGGLETRYRISGGEKSLVILDFRKTDCLNQGDRIARRIDILKESIVQWVGRHECLIHGGCIISQDMVGGHDSDQPVGGMETENCFRQGI